MPPEELGTLWRRMESSVAAWKSGRRGKPRSPGSVGEPGASRPGARGENPKADPSRHTTEQMTEFHFEEEKTDDLIGRASTTSV